MPAQLSRQNPEAYKNQFGHVLILAGSARMLGAAALCGLSAMRSGAGLATLGVPKNLNTALQKKISPVLMTWPLPETPRRAFALSAWKTILPELEHFSAAAIGPGLSHEPATKKFVRAVITRSPVPLVIDADALTALADDTSILSKTETPKILTPHPGEFLKLLGPSHNTKAIKEGLQTSGFRKTSALEFSRRHGCILVLKGHKTVVASPDGRFFVNTTGNSGMATAGSGDVLTGMISAFLSQGLPVFNAAQWGVYLHGMAGDIAAKKTGKTALIAVDIINNIPEALHRAERARR